MNFRKQVITATAALATIPVTFAVTIEEVVVPQIGIINEIGMGDLWSKVYRLLVAGLIIILFTTYIKLAGESMGDQDNLDKAEQLKKFYGRALQVLIGLVIFPLIVNFLL